MLSNDELSEVYKYLNDRYKEAKKEFYNNEEVKKNASMLEKHQLFNLIDSKKNSSDPKDRGMAVRMIKDNFCK